MTEPDWCEPGAGCVLVSSDRAGADNHVYHTGPCETVERLGPDRTRERRRDRLPEGWRECKYCSGEDARGSKSTQEMTCPLCGECVAILADHILAAHDADGGVGDA